MTPKFFCCKSSIYKCHKFEFLFLGFEFLYLIFLQENENFLKSIDDDEANVFNFCTLSLSLFVVDKRRFFVFNEAYLDYDDDDKR